MINQPPPITVRGPPPGIEPDCGTPSFRERVQNHLSPRPTRPGPSPAGREGPGGSGGRNFNRGVGGAPINVPNMVPVSRFSNYYHPPRNSKRNSTKTKTNSKQNLKSQTKRQTVTQTTSLLRTSDQQNLNNLRKSNTFSQGLSQTQSQQSNQSRSPTDQCHSEYNNDYQYNKKSQTFNGFASPLSYSISYLPRQSAPPIENNNSQNLNIVLDQSDSNSNTVTNMPNSNLNSNWNSDSGLGSGSTNNLRIAPYSYKVNCSYEKFNLKNTSRLKSKSLPQSYSNSPCRDSPCNQDSNATYFKGDDNYIADHNDHTQLATSTQTGNHGHIINDNDDHEDNLMLPLSLLDHRKSIGNQFDILSKDTVVTETKNQKRKTVQVNSDSVLLIEPEQLQLQLNQLYQQPQDSTISGGAPSEEILDSESIMDYYHNGSQSCPHITSTLCQTQTTQATQSYQDQFQQSQSDEQNSLNQIQIIRTKDSKSSKSKYRGSYSARNANIEIWSQDSESDSEGDVINNDDKDNVMTSTKRQYLNTNGRRDHNKMSSHQYHELKYSYQSKISVSGKVLQYKQGRHTVVGLSQCDQYSRGSKQQYGESDSENSDQDNDNNSIYSEANSTKQTEIQDLTTTQTEINEMSNISNLNLSDITHSKQCYGNGTTSSSQQIQNSDSEKTLLNLQNLSLTSNVTTAFTYQCHDQYSDNLNNDSQTQSPVEQTGSCDVAVGDGDDTEDPLYQKLSRLADSCRTQNQNQNQNHQIEAEENLFKPIQNKTGFTLDFGSSSNSNTNSNAIACQNSNFQQQFQSQNQICFQSQTQDLQLQQNLNQTNQNQIVNWNNIIMQNQTEQNISNIYNRFNSNSQTNFFQQQQQMQFSGGSGMCNNNNLSTIPAQSQNQNWNSNGHATDQQQIQNYNTINSSQFQNLNNVQNQNQMIQHQLQVQQPLPMANVSQSASWGLQNQTPSPPVPAVPQNALTDLIRRFDSQGPSNQKQSQEEVNQSTETNTSLQDTSGIYQFYSATSQCCQEVYNSSDSNFSPGSIGNSDTVRNLKQNLNNFDKIDFNKTQGDSQNLKNNKSQTQSQQQNQQVQNQIQTQAQQGQQCQQSQTPQGQTQTDPKLSPLLRQGRPPTQSVGSKEHAESRCKPCAFYHREVGCHYGEDCMYCHLCSIGEIKRRKKSKQSLKKLFSQHLGNLGIQVGLGGGGNGNNMNATESISNSSNNLTANQNLSNSNTSEGLGQNQYQTSSDVTNQKGGQGQENDIIFKTVTQVLNSVLQQNHLLNYTSEGQNRANRNKSINSILFNSSNLQTVVAYLQENKHVMSKICLSSTMASSLRLRNNKGKKSDSDDNFICREVNDQDSDHDDENELSDPDHQAIQQLINDAQAWDAERQQKQQQQYQVQGPVTNTQTSDDSTNHNTIQTQQSQTQSQTQTQQSNSYVHPNRRGQSNSISNLTNFNFPNQTLSTVSKSMSTTVPSESNQELVSSESHSTNNNSIQNWNNSSYKWPTQFQKQYSGPQYSQGSGPGSYKSLNRKSNSNSYQQQYQYGTAQTQSQYNKNVLLLENYIPESDAARGLGRNSNMNYQAQKNYVDLDQRSLNNMLNQFNQETFGTHSQNQNNRHGHNNTAHIQQGPGSSNW